MTYKLSQKADHDLFSLYLEGIEEHGVLQADIYYDELVGALNLLANHPEMARVRFELDPAVRVHPHKEHIIIYDVEEDGLRSVDEWTSQSSNWLAYPLMK